jgi:hypothetical protein
VQNGVLNLGASRGFLSAGGRVFQKGQRFFMNAEQAFEAQAQGGIIATGLIQISSALVGVQFQGGAKEDHFTTGWGVHLLSNIPRYDLCNQTAYYRCRLAAAFIFSSSSVWAIFGSRTHFREFVSPWP